MKIGIIGNGSRSRLGMLLLASGAMAVARDPMFGVAMGLEPTKPKTKAHDDRWPEPLSQGEQLMRDHGETPESMRHHRERSEAAERKRLRRIERNLINEARQGRAPEGLELTKAGKWFACCRSCERNYEIYCEAHEFEPDQSYCGRNEWCTP